MQAGREHVAWLASASHNLQELHAWFDIPGKQPRGEGRFDRTLTQLSVALLMAD